MASDKGGLNGSVNVLADAMRQVFTEAVEKTAEPLQNEMKAMRTDMRDMEGRLNKKIDATEKRLNKRVDTTNENVQAQLAQHREDVRADIQEALKGD